MTNRWMVAAVLAAASTMAAACAQGQVTAPAAPRLSQAAPRGEAPAQRSAATLPTVQARFDAHVRADRSPGIVGAFGRRGEPVAIAAAGAITADPGAARADGDSLWRVYSMTKPITGMAAMMLVEDGKLSLDQPISDFFPGFARMTVLTDPDTSLASRPARTAITVRHLMTHTAGLGYSITTKGPLLREYERLGILPAAVNLQMEAGMAAVRPQSLSAFAERVATLPLIAEPGTKWSYSIGLDVLGAVIEKASGMSFERFLATRLFEPLGMRSTYWQVPGSEAGRLATNYAFVGDNLVPFDPASASVYLEPPSFPYGGAGLVMSARDHDRFLAMLLAGGELDGRRVMRAETVRQAMSNLLPAGVTFGGAAASTGGTQGPRMGFGAGGSVYLDDVPGAAGAGTFGWSGAAGTIGWVDPKNGVRGTIMVNYFPAEKWPLRAEIVPAAYADLMR